MHYTFSGVRLRGRLAALIALVCTAALMGALVDAADAKAQGSNSKTFVLPAHTTKTFQVRYPFALRFSGTTYSCRATVSGLGKRFVRILSRRSALGGTVCRVRARNNAALPSLDTTAKVTVTAITQKSNGKAFVLPAHTTKTFQVRYPFALRFSGATYSCKAVVSGLGKRFVRILSRGSALGGTVCRVRARNNAALPSLDTTAKVRVIATTNL
jgi:hypothetical protein